MIEITRRIEHLDPHSLNVFIYDELSVGEHERIRSDVEHSHLCPLYLFSVKKLKTAIVRAGLRSEPCATGSAKANYTGNGKLIHFGSQPILRAAVNQLLPIFREVLIFCDVKELNYEDIALILDISVSTVISRISDTRDALYELLILQHRKSQ